MDSQIKEAIWSQYGAAIDTLEAAIKHCPDDVWGDKSNFHEIWYMASHTLFWLDFYLEGEKEGFVPPAPFGLEELDPAGKLPPRVYTKDELLDYLEHGRKKCKEVIRRLTDETAHQSAGSVRPNLTGLELLLYNMRHVQHHAAQINLLLRQRIDSAPRWVSKAGSKLSDQ